MADSGKIALCWVDILLVVFVIACGSTLWDGTKRVVAWNRQSVRPVKTTFEHEAHLPQRRAELANAEKRFESIRDALTEAEITTIRVTAEMRGEEKNPLRNATPEQLARAADELRQRHLKLDTAATTIQALQTESAETMKRVLDSGVAVSRATLASEMAYSTASRWFEFESRIRTIAFGVAIWLPLLAAAWAGCGIAKRRLGQCHRAFVMIGSVLFLGALSVYELLR